MAIFYKYCKERHSELWIDIINHISWWILNTWILLKIVVLKSVFSEIRVMTGVWVVSCQRTGFWLANLSGLPIKGLFSDRKPLELMSWQGSFTLYAQPKHVFINIHKRFQNLQVYLEHFYHIEFLLCI